MKYIRTKDGVYDTHLSLYLGNTDSGNKAVIGKDGKVGVIVSEADTIEELCDEFIIVTNDSHHIKLADVNALQGFSIIKASKIECLYEVYGAIWTNKGLIYVAKLNKKGELELL